ncbi:MULTISPECIES: PhzF family phenazine biosynthesis protein [Methylobacterium]|uniref:Trans-2,3-dihydro-3-hydroxyanthranilate isomerase n=1 Tax=Methylobacterium thuringiense TaxID=1003091 RepID=A0ABQ4TLT2_9HYPH|nr:MULTISPECIES: PhzF family phenazine biosynthesis protein [Methylobacterium]TXN24199.1 PhzF family phenazine biosynthesis protein [Methylobacterium sp. WL9]GJE56251.1 Trans-2,3-dihydro-3-hydroxyanthranilate isomerase [Methylobacterium thuringiense]
MTRRRFVTLDVFTETAFAGNPLAVVLDAEGLDDAAMQAIAREFNLSETVFVLPPQEARHRARLRIFTPLAELPFAGHPTIGTAVLLALKDRAAHKSETQADATAFGLEEGIGIVPCLVETGKGRGRARFKVPGLPVFAGDGLEASILEGMLGLQPGEVGFSRHKASRHGAGVPFTFVPVATRDALDRARLDTAAFDRAVAAGKTGALYLYTPDPAPNGRRYQARLFAPNLGIVEDPATGSAAAAFAGVLMQFEKLGDGTHDVVLRQGYAMGRPSEIALQAVVEAGALRSVEIGGAAVVVSEGALLV